MIELKIASKTDIPTISELAFHIWQAHYPSIIGKEQTDYMLEKMYSHQAIQKQMEDGQDFYMIIYHQTIVGYLAISFLNEQTLMLNKFYIDSKFQGKKIGEIAFQQLIKIYTSVSAIELTVNRQNYKSINFYFKLGFTIRTIADFDIGNGYFMNDFIMKYKLSSHI